MCEHNYVPPPSSTLTCPQCKIVRHTTSLLEIYEELESRGGIIKSKNTASLHKRAGEKDHPEVVAHGKLCRRWRKEKVRFLKDLRKIEKEREKLKKKGIEEECSRLEDALAMWESRVEDLAEVPGVKMMTPEELKKKEEEKTEEKEAFVSRMVANLVVNLLDVIMEDEELREMYKEQPPLQISLPRSKRRREEMETSSSPSTTHGGAEHPRPKKRVRFSEDVTLSPDHLNLVPMSATPSPLNPAPSPVTVPHRRQTDAEHQRFRDCFLRRPPFYKPGRWTSPEGYEKADTSYCKYKYNGPKVWKWHNGVRDPETEEEAKLWQDLKVVSGAWVLGWYVIGAAENWGKGGKKKKRKTRKTK